MEPETIIASGAQTVPNLLSIRTEELNTIHRLPADVRTGAMHRTINENYTIFYEHVNHK